MASKKKTKKMIGSPLPTDSFLEKSLNQDGGTFVHFNIPSPSEEINEPLPSLSPEFSAAFVTSDSPAIDFKPLHDGSGADVFAALKPKERWDFDYDANQSVKSCPCGESFCITGRTEEISNLRAWEALHRPHLVARPNPTERVEQQLLREQELLPSTSWFMTRRYSGTPYEQGDIVDDHIVLRCVPSVRVMNNYVAYVQPLSPKQERALWQKAFWNSWRR